MNYSTNYIFIKTYRESTTPRTPEESFYYFIKNSKITLLNDESSYGLIFKSCFTNPENKSPYFYVDSMGNMSNVLTIVLKLAIVCENQNETNCEHWDYKKIGMSYMLKRCFQYKQDFYSECSIQSDISKKMIMKLIRNTPILLFSKLYTNESKNYRKLAKILSKQCENKFAINQIINQFADYSKNPTFYFGIIAMEYIMPNYTHYCNINNTIIMEEIKSIGENLDKHDTIALSKKSRKIRWLYNKARCELLILALETGYTQGDYHTENILIDEKENKLMIIDFGRASRIPNMDEIRELWEEVLRAYYVIDDINFNNIQRILQYIFDTTFKTKLYPFDEYNWIKNIDMDDIKYILRIHRDKMRNNNTDLFNMYLSKPTEYIFEVGFVVDNEMTIYQKIINRIHLFARCYRKSHIIPFNDGNVLNS